jgi:hypothetical protein
VKRRLLVGLGVLLSGLSVGLAVGGLNLVNALWVLDSHLRANLLHALGRVNRRAVPVVIHCLHISQSVYELMWGCLLRVPSS